MLTIKYNWIDWFQIFSLIILAPFFLFPSMERTWVFLIVPSILIGRWIIKRQFLERTILDWAILLLSIQIFVSCLIVPDIGFSLPKIACALFAIVLFYAIVALLKTIKLIRIGVILFIGGGLLFSILGLLGMFTKEEKHLDLLMKIKEQIPQINFNLPGAGEGFHPNAVGGTLILIIPLFFIFVYSNFRWENENDLIIKNKLFSIVLFLGLLITSGVLLLTQSRGSWLGLILSSCILLFPFLEKRKIRVSSIFLFFPIVLFLFVSVYVMLIGTQKIQLSITEIIGKVGGRSQAWTVGIETVKHRPLTGIGMNRIRLNPEISFKRAHVHNHLLHTTAEMGIPALIALLAILIGMGIMCVQVWKKSTVRWMRMTVLGLGYGQSAHLIFGMTDSISLGAKVGIFFWLSLGLISAMYNYTIKVRG